MISVEDTKPAVSGAFVAVASSFIFNPTLAVGAGAFTATVTKSVTKPKANFLLVGGLMFVIIGLGGSVAGTLPGGVVVALAGVVGGVVGGVFLWLDAKMRQSALGRIVRLIWTLTHFSATLVVILKIAIVLPVTFFFGVVGADVPIFGEAAFLLYCFAVLASFYAIDQGKSLLQVRRKLRGPRRNRVEDLKTAAEKAEATAQKAESAGAAVRDMQDTDDVKAAASSAKESVDSTRDRVSDAVSASESDDSESTASAQDDPEVSASDATTADTGVTADTGIAADAGVGADTGTENTADTETASQAPEPNSSDPDSVGTNSSETDSPKTESVGTGWLADTTLAVKNEASNPKSVRVGCRVDGERKLADDVRLAPGERSEWDDLPDDSEFEIGVIVENGPSEGKRFTSAGSPHGEIGIVVRDSDVEFTDSLPSESPQNAASSSRDSAAGDRSAGATSGTEASNASEDDEFWAEFESSGTEAGTVGGTPAGGTTAGGALASDAGAESNGDESWDSAAELTDAIRESPSSERVEQLTAFLDSRSPGERLEAATELRQSADEYPEAVATAVPSLASLLDDEDVKIRQESIATLQRLANSRPGAVADATRACIDCLSDENPKVRTMACRVLGEVNATHVTDRLEALSNEDPNKGVQVAAFQAMQTMDD